MHLLSHIHSCQQRLVESAFTVSSTISGSLILLSRRLVRVEESSPVHPTRIKRFLPWTPLQAHVSTPTAVAPGQWPEKEEVPSLDPVIAHPLVWMWSQDTTNTTAVLLELCKSILLSRTTDIILHYCNQVCLFFLNLIYSEVLIKYT